MKNWVVMIDERKRHIEKIFVSDDAKDPRLADIFNEWTHAFGHAWDIVMARVEDMTTLKSKLPGYTGWDTAEIQGKTD